MAINVIATDNPQTLANTIVDDVVISNVTYAGASSASGTFTNGLTSGLGINEGTILTTGNVNNATNNGFFNTSNGFSGDANLNTALAELIPNNSASDINEPASLEFDFETDGEDVSFDLIFATDETVSDEFDITFNDVFGLFLDGENIAFVPGTDTPVAVNSISASESSSDIGYDFFTDVFTVELNDLEPGTYTLQFAIADAVDDVVDSAILIEGDVLVENQPLNPIGSFEDEEIFGTERDEEFLGSDGNDGITGNAADNTIVGKSGNDAIDGKAGNDTLDGGADTDTAVYQFDPAGITVDLSTGSATDGYGDSDVLIDIENIIASEFDDNLTGDDNANSLTGRDGNDTIDALGGNDFLTGSNGSDNLTGGTGSDSFVYLSPEEGNDTITDFELGTDKIVIITAAFGGLSGGSVSSAQFTIGSSASDSSQRFIFDDGSGDLFFDEDGDGSAGQELIANVGAGSGFGASDIQLL